LTCRDPRVKDPRYGMSTEAREHRRLAIASGLISDAIPRARADRTFPVWAHRALASDRRFGSRDRRYYRELIYTSVRFLPWIEKVRAEDRGLAALWLSADIVETADARTALSINPRRGAACPRPSVQEEEQGRAQGTPLQLRAADLQISERAAAFNHTFAGTDASPDSLLPDWVRDECPALLEPNEAATVHSRAPLWLRATSGDVASAISALARESIDAALDIRVPGAIRILAGPDVTRTQAYAAGLVEVQDIGSQWVLHTAGVAPGERWLDACAGAGGKTLQLAAMVGANTPVVAHDIRAEAIEETKSRAARAGIQSIRATTKVDGEFDAVLVDAPCSGSGTWRRSPHLKWQTSREDLAKFAARQLDVLRRFSSHVRTGGRLVYATCSIAQTENEGVVKAFVAAEPGFAVEFPGATLLPSQLDSDGFFVAVMRRGSM
jgi:16S rRNA (cytosine967-C5)-methyltransferase